MSNLVEFVPLLQILRLPLIRCAHRLHSDLVATYGGLVKDVEQDMAHGLKVKDCLAKKMFEMKEQEQLDNLDIALLASAFMIGGVETVSYIRLR